jgi:5-(carboxyamino)imidazole ribonucleotide synthase
MDGSVATFPVCENIHHANILHMTFVPARVDERIQQEAVSLARGIIESFQLVGLLCVEFFVTRHGRVLVNEIAPRPHNSGHFSLDACSVSQFEALVRTICGLDMETPRLLSPCAMINLLGEDLERLDAEALHRLPGVKLHLYGKAEPRPKRKMGHITVLQHSQKEVERIISVIEEMISAEEPQTRDVLTR